MSSKKRLSSDNEEQTKLLKLDTKYASDVLDSEKEKILHSPTSTSKEKSDDTTNLDGLKRTAKTASWNAPKLVLPSDRAKKTPRSLLQSLSARDNDKIKENQIEQSSITEKEKEKNKEKNKWVKVNKKHIKQKEEEIKGQLKLMGLEWKEGKPLRATRSESTPTPAANSRSFSRAPKSSSLSIHSSNNNNNNDSENIDPNPEFRVFGVKLDYLVTRQKNGSQFAHLRVPNLVYQIIELLISSEGYKASGIFRLCGHHATLLFYEKYIDKHGDILFPFKLETEKNEQQNTRFIEIAKSTSSDLEQPTTPKGESPKFLTTTPSPRSPGSARLQIGAYDEKNPVRRNLSANQLNAIDDTKRSSSTFTNITPAVISSTSNDINNNNNTNNVNNNNANNNMNSNMMNELLKNESETQCISENNNNNATPTITTNNTTINDKSNNNDIKVIEDCEYEDEKEKIEKDMFSDSEGNSSESENGDVYDDDVENIIVYSDNDSSEDDSDVTNLEERLLNREKTTPLPTNTLNKSVLPKLDVHTLSELLKSFLRKLPDPIIPRSPFFSYFIQFSAMNKEEIRVASYAALMKSLPENNFHLMKYLCSFFNQIAQNKEITLMGANNLGVIFAPCVFGSMDQDRDIDIATIDHISMCKESKFTAEITADIILHQSEIFNEDVEPIRAYVAKEFIQTDDNNLHSILRGDSVLIIKKLPEKNSYGVVVGDGIWTEIKENNYKFFEGIDETPLSALKRRPIATLFASKRMINNSDAHTPAGPSPAKAAMKKEERKRRGVSVGFFNHFLK